MFKVTVELDNGVVNTSVVHENVERAGFDGVVLHLFIKDQVQVRQYVLCGQEELEAGNLQEEQFTRFSITA